MKKFFVTTQTANNRHILHCSFSLHRGGFAEFSTNNLIEAQAFFEKEVAQLRQEYKTIDQMPFSPNDYEMANAIYCSLFALDDAEELPDVEYIKDSEYFF